MQSTKRWPLSSTFDRRIPCLQRWARSSLRPASDVSARNLVSLRAAGGGRVCGDVRPLMRCRTLVGMDSQREVELVFAPQEEGGFHVYAPDLPGLHTQGDTLEEAMVNASEALELYVEGLREEGRTLDFGVVRRRFPLPA